MLSLHSLKRFNYVNPTKEDPFDQRWAQHEYKEWHPRRGFLRGIMWSYEDVRHEMIAQRLINPTAPTASSIRGNYFLVALSIEGVNSSLESLFEIDHNTRP